jgi:hypothetical protein
MVLDDLPVPADQMLGAQDGPEFGTNRPRYEGTEVPRAIRVR